MENTKLIKEVDFKLFEIYKRIGIDKPSNHEDIIQFVSEDVDACSDEDFSSEDVLIAFRRMIETYVY